MTDVLQLEKKYSASTKLTHLDHAYFYVPHIVDIFQEFLLGFSDVAQLLL